MLARAILDAYLDDALGETETAEVEQMLRLHEGARLQLQSLIHERDRGEHSVGAIWRRQRLTCPTREQLGTYLLRALDEPERDYVTFHLRTIACAYCLANLADLQAQQETPAPQALERRQRVFQSSAGLLRRAPR